jgi:sulfate adenylyltransferase
LSSELGFSAKDRSINVRRIGYVASEIVKHGGTVVVANIAPYEADRIWNRQVIGATHGKYIEVFLDTPLEVCESRDVKGLYKKARAGLLKGMTGIDDPFDQPNEAAVLRLQLQTYEELKEAVEQVLMRIM